MKIGNLAHEIILKFLDSNSRPLNNNALSTEPAYDNKGPYLYLIFFVIVTVIVTVIVPYAMFILLL